MGMEACIDKLLRNNDLPDPPVKYVQDGNGANQVNDPEVSFGETWVNASLYPDPELVPDPRDQNRIIGYRRISMVAWSFLQYHKHEISIREKLTLFWHNHFVVADFNFAQIAFLYNNLLRSSSLGNFRDLSKEITLDVGMLLYLDGARNTRRAPNENFARELLELFTVGKGELAGPGDYTTFTEDDVMEMAKILSGWTIRYDRDRNDLRVVFFNWNHYRGDKQLSHRFNKAVIPDSAEEEYVKLINVIFEQKVCSLFIARKLFRWFVHYNIDAGIEANIIDPLARSIRENNYDILPALRSLLSSEYFYNQVSCMVKNPIDWWLSVTQGLGLARPDKGIPYNYLYGQFAYYICNDLGMGIFNHPDVAGWKAYYQEPQFYRYWIDNVSLPKRNQVSVALVKGGQVTANDIQFGVSPLIPVLDLAASLSNPLDPNLLIMDLSKILFPYAVTEEQKDYLKEILIPGLPDFEWTVEYQEYLDDPGNDQKKQAIINRLRDLIAAMVQMPEFQLM